MGSDATLSGGQLVNNDGSLLTAPYTATGPGWGDQWTRARREAATRQVRVHFWGGSVTDGYPGPTLSESTSWRGLVSAWLRTTYGDGGTGYIHAGAGSDLVAETGTWTATAGTAGSEHRASAAASKAFTGLRGTTIKIFHRNVISPTGSFRYRVNGGGFTTVVPPTGFSQEPGTVTISGLSATATHTLDIEWVSGTIGIHGVEASYSTGIVCCNCAYGGRALQEYGKRVEKQLTVGVTNTSGTVTMASPGDFHAGMIGKYLSSEAAGLPASANHTVTAVASATSLTVSPVASATDAALVTDLHVYPGNNAGISYRTATPLFAESLGRPDLVIVGIGVNDMATPGGSVQSALSGLSNILKGGYMGGAYNDTTHSYSPDVIVIGEHQGAFTDYLGIGPAIVADAASFTTGIGGAFIDFWSVGRRSYDFANAKGWFADTVHLSDTGSTVCANTVTELLRR